MLSILAEGVLTTDPVSRTAANGNPYATARMRVTGADGESILCNLITFNQDAVQALASLHAGDTVAVAGHAAISQWAGKDGHPRAGLSVTVTRAMSVYAAGRQRKAAA